MRLRPAISIGSQASGISALMKSGYVSPQTKLIMQPIDVPMISLRCVTRRPSVSIRCCAVTMSS